MDIFSYPYDDEFILRKQKKLKKELLTGGRDFIEKKIAVLCGSTVDSILPILELFLLYHGIKPLFWKSDYNRFYETAVFINQELVDFCPDIIYIHTSQRNITECIDDEIKKYNTIWEKIKENYNCVIIQNNFEYPLERITGNISTVNGKINQINKLDIAISEYANSNQNFYINDINYLSATIGLEKWTSAQDWFLYKNFLSVKVIPDFCANLANIIKSLYGKNKKAIALDLDNTLWGGVVGDDGVENIVIGQETYVGQAYLDFQKYIKSLKDNGAILTVISKNDYENAVAGIQKRENILSENDFSRITANWKSKDENLVETAENLNIFTDSFVFVDDNPAERLIVSANVPGVAVPEIGEISDFIRVMDRNGYFEVTNISDDDKSRTEMYRHNAQRNQMQSQFSDYNEYLRSLEMVAEIYPFNSESISRVTQLSNKSNQFNCTTRRYTLAEIETISKSDNYITLYGRLMDKFGDNGIVSAVIGEIKGVELHIDLWIMSCRVLKRNMEFAMINKLVKICQDKNIQKVYGYYFPTNKNSMVKDLYPNFGFSKFDENTFILDINDCNIFETEIKYD